MSFKTDEPEFDVFEYIKNSQKYSIDLCNKNNKFYDKIDIKKFDYFLRNFKEIEPQLKKDVEDDRKKFKRHSNYNYETALNNIKNNIVILPHLNNTPYGYIRTEYNKGEKSNNKGRAYVNRFIGIQQIITPLRGLICNDIYDDIDIINCHPSILIQLFNKYNIDSPNLIKYINNRTEILNKVSNEEGCIETEAKQKILSIIYGSKKYKGEYLKVLYYEIYNNINKLIYRDEFKEIIEEFKAEKKYNIEGGIISRIIHDIEHNILEALLEYFNYKGFIPKINNRFIVSSIFDGFQILKNDRLNNDVIKESEEYAEYKTGYKISLKIKPFQTCINLPKNYEVEFNKLRYTNILNEIENNNNDDTQKQEEDEGANIISSPDDDEGAAEILITFYKDRLLICNGTLYANNGRIWNGDDKEVNKILSNMLKSLNIKYYGADGKRKYNYSNSTKHQQNAIKAIKNSLDIKVDNMFIENININNKYYLPYLNGVYDFRKKHLIRWDELPENIYFMFIIQRELKEYNNDDYKELLERVINPIYPNEKIKLFNAQIKARAIAGCVQDKRYYQQIGARNSGKGVETDLIKYCFGDYISNFDTSCLLYNKNRPHEAKNLSWLDNKKFARMLIGNEVDKIDEDKQKNKDPPILNGKLLKQLASGGDKMEIRQNYKNEYEFKIGFTIFINSNDLINITTQDAKENLIIIEYGSKFVKKEELIEGCEYYKLKDDNIKDLIKQDRIINAYSWYILNNFLDEVPEEPEEIKISTEINNKTEQQPVESFIFKNFKNTDDKNDKYHIEKLKEILNENGYSTGNQITTIFSRVKIGEYNKNITIDGVKKAGFIKLKYLNE